MVSPVRSRDRESSPVKRKEKRCYQHGAAGPVEI